MKLKVWEKEIEFKYEPGDAPFYIFAGQQQMEQALINIVKNSIETMDGKGTPRFDVCPT